MSENKQSDSPSKAGELITVFNGLHIESLGHNANRPSTSGMPLGQTNSDTQPNRSVLNGVRARMRLRGSENVIPTPSRPASDRPTAVVIPFSHSSTNVPNGE